MLATSLIFLLACGSNQDEQKELEYDKVGPVTDDVELHAPEAEEGEVQRKDLPEEDTTNQPD